MSTDIQSAGAEDRTELSSPTPTGSHTKTSGGQTEGAGSTRWIVHLHFHTSSLKVQFVKLSLRPPPPYFLFIYFFLGALLSHIQLFSTGHEFIENICTLYGTHPRQSS